MTTEQPRAHDVIVGADKDAVVSVVAQRLVDRLTVLCAERPTVHLALTGGGAGIDVLAAVAADPSSREVDWKRVHFWWSDERYIAATDPERNALQARVALLDGLPISETNVHEIASSDHSSSAEAAADAYIAELARYSPSADAGYATWPSFDICLLGVGPDAHIASLFPDSGELEVTNRAVLAVHDSPKPPPVRVTLTRPVINSSQRVWMVVTGAEKAAALKLALMGANYTSVPAAGVKGQRSTLFFVDEAACSDLPSRFIDSE